GELREALGDLVERRDAHRLQVAPEHRFDRALPAGLYGEPFREAAPIDEGRTLEPLADLLRGLAERRLLQRFERCEPTAVVLQLRAQLIELGGDLLLLIAKFLDLLPNGIEQPGCLGDLRLQGLLLDRHVLETLFELLEAQRLALGRLPLLLPRKPVPLRRKLLEPRLLGLSGAFHVGNVARDLLPALTPLLHRRLGLV